jgi:hypothetical protein|tara:strand:+ start:644 stop:856 length:213 start_codon:yes stop_codon:yes gene_type:complete
MPNFPNLQKFATKATMGNSPSIDVTRTEAQHIALEYQKLLAYTIELQGKVIQLQQEINTPTQVDVVSNDF